jgi:hypothetical protein
VPENLATSHYLLRLEQEQWNKGNKVSKPRLSYVAKEDFVSFEQDSFYQKHNYIVEILHDPTGEAVKLSAGGTAPPHVTGPNVVELRQRYADLMQVDVEQVDQSLSVQDLATLIKDAEKTE